jgi:starch phosphorylase
LKQQHFFVSCSLQDMLRSLEQRGLPVSEFPDHWAVQLNETHPAIAVAELMRLLIDDKHLDWEEAWSITSRSVAYTNHTLLPEALERWGLALFGSLLPRHLEVIYEINRRFLQQLRLRHPGNDQILRRLSIIDEEGTKAVRMANLAVVGSHQVNGVAELHSKLMVENVFADFAALWPERFTNVTNGVTPRRWLALANPALSGLIDRQIGPQWRTGLERLEALDALSGDQAFIAALQATKISNKQRLAQYVERVTGVRINPNSLFDVQIKRIHEYKRQLLNVLHVITRYNRILAEPERNWQPRTVIFGGKAASAYAMAKLIIKLINDVGQTINADPRIGDRLKVVFVPNYGVSVASLIIPALAARRFEPKWRLFAGYAVGIIGYVSGIIASSLLDLPTGAMIVVTMCLTFALSVMLVKAHPVTW